MKKLLVIMGGIALMALPMTALAGVSGSDHDMRAYAGAGAVTKELCEACHTPHNAQGEKLWARAVGGPFTGVQNLCYTCHDGTITTIGATTVFNAALEQHKTVGPDCSGDGACHDVHNQNPAGSGRFLVVTDTDADGAYCDECHGATPFSGAEGLGDHTASGNHPVDVAGTGGTLTCDGCHTPHGATAQTVDYGGLTNHALLASNYDGTIYGQFCVSCHSGTAPTPAVTGTGGISPANPYNYSETAIDGTQTKHTTMAAAGDDGFAIGGCNLCHDVHNPASTNKYLLLGDNVNSDYCQTCHDGVSAQGTGATSHPVDVVPADVNMNSGATPALPWSNQIDDDPTVGADWASAAVNNIVCETCHSVHRNGFTGTDAQFFLRHPNGTANQLCTQCHSAN